MGFFKDISALPKVFVQICVRSYPVLSRQRGDRQHSSSSTTIILQAHSEPMLRPWGGPSSAPGHNFSLWVVSDDKDTVVVYYISNCNNI